MKKYLNLILASFVILNALAAQSGEQPVNLDSIFPLDPIYYQKNADTCRPAEVVSLSVIQYDGYAKAYLQLSGTAPNQTISYQPAGVQATASNVALNAGAVLLNGLQVNKTYTLHARNSCGQVVETATINTQTTPQDIIVVSEPLYNAVTSYLAMETKPPFSAYLSNLPVNPYEKIAFIQQYFYKGAKFLQDQGTRLPNLPENFNQSDCFCNLIATSSVATPGIMNFSEKKIYEYSQPGSGLPKTSLGTNTQTWYWLNNKGAAKWHQLHTEGFKSEKGIDYSVTKNWANGTTTSSQQAFIKVTLMCMDNDEVPKECDCTKTVKFWYRYDTRATAFATINNGPEGSKNAAASAEDFAIATIWEEFNPKSVQVLKMCVTRAEALCNINTNPAFWSNLSQLFTSQIQLAATIFGVSQNNNQNISQEAINKLSTGIQNYVNSNLQVLNTPYYNATTCGNSDEKFDKLDGEISHLFRPNKSVVLSINSYNRLFSTGRRAWNAWSRINSNFSIAAKIDVNRTEGIPIHCCSPQIGSWIVASCDGPLPTEQLKTMVAEQLFHAGIINLPPSAYGNGYNVPGEYGFWVTPSVYSECNNINVTPNNSPR